MRFVAPHVPHGHYDLCVVANGISSHCESFHHRRPSKACRCEASCACAAACEDPCGDEGSAIDHDILNLKREVQSLRKSVYMLAARIRLEEPHREPKKSHRDDDDDDSKKGKSGGRD